MPTKLRRLLGAALFAACVASPAAAQAPQGPWLTLAPFPVPSAPSAGVSSTRGGLAARGAAAAGGAAVSSG